MEMMGGHGHNVPPLPVRIPELQRSLSANVFNKADQRDNIDQALEIAITSLTEPGQSCTGQYPAQKWEFVNEQSQQLKDTRRFIRVHAARISSRKRLGRSEKVSSANTNIDANNEVVQDVNADLPVSRRQICLPQRDQISRSRASIYGPISTVGSGRIDPFKSLPSNWDSPELDECFAYFSTIYLPQLQLVDENGVTNPIAKAWLPQLVSNPLLFHGAILSSATSLSILNNTKKHHLMRIYHEGQIIKELSQVLRDPNQKMYTNDELVMAVSALALDGGTILPVSDDSPFNTPLTGLSAVNQRGRIELEERHIKAVYELVKMRGGLQGVKIPYVAASLSSATIVASTVALQSSPLPYISPFSQPWDQNWDEAIVLKNLTTQGSLLPKLVILDFSQQIINLSYDLHEQTRKIQQYCEKMVFMSKIQIAEYNDMRHVVHHRLITLPALDDKPVYESYRQALWIYSFAVTFGVPFHENIRQKLVLRLITSLKQAEDDPSWCLLPEALLWIIFFGGITATGSPERDWFVKKTACQLAVLELKTWTEVKSVLSSFLWLGIACDSGGKALYAEASSIVTPALIEQTEALVRGED